VLLAFQRLNRVWSFDDLDPDVERALVIVGRKSEPTLVNSEDDRFFARSVFIILTVDVNAGDLKGVGPPAPGPRQTPKAATRFVSSLDAPDRYIMRARSTSGERAGERDARPNPLCRSGQIPVYGPLRSRTPCRNSAVEIKNNRRHAGERDADGGSFDGDELDGFCRRGQGLSLSTVRQPRSQKQRRHCQSEAELRAAPDRECLKHENPFRPCSLSPLFLSTKSQRTLGGVNDYGDRIVFIHK